MARAQLKLAGEDTVNQTNSQPRSREREALAKAVAARNDADQRVDAIGQAQETAASARRKAQDALEQAEANVEVAKTQAARHLVDSALGKGGSPPTTVQASRAAVHSAKDDLDAAEHAEVELGRELKSAEQKLELADRRVDDAIRAALAADPAVHKLIAEKEDLHRRLRDIDAALWIVTSPFEPTTSNHANELNQVKKLAPDWWDAVVALRDDADHPLPNTD